MFNVVFQDESNQILINRLNRLMNTLRAFSAPTREAYTVEVYSSLNSILARGNQMTKLDVIEGESPALISQISDNFNDLNNDALDIVAQLEFLENSMSQLYNLSAASQNKIRQTIRERVYASNQSEFIEDFVNTKQLDATSTGSVDPGAAIATLPLTSDTPITGAVITVGPNSVGSTMDAASLLTNGRIDTKFTWIGSVLELIIQFPTVPIINRIQIQQDVYQGLEIAEFTTSPDGVLREDITADLLPAQLDLNGSSNKFSGDVILDFNPRSVATMRLLLVDQLGVGSIALRQIGFNQRLYSSTGIIQTTAIDQPTGSVMFSATSKVAATLTSVAHQISYDGVHFQGINDGDVISLQQTPFFYRAMLQRLDDAFQNASSPLLTTGDPDLSPNYTLGQISSVNLQGGVIERIIQFPSVSGPITLNETPIAGTLVVYNGNVFVPASQYTFNNNVLTFATPQTNITVQYQTSALGTAGLTIRQNYYSPYLYEVSFQKVD